MPNDFEHSITHCHATMIKEDFQEPRWISDMDFMAPPAVISALQEKISKGIFGYKTMPLTFFTSIQDWILEQHHWKINQEWLVHSRGTISALSMLIRCFSEPGDKIIIQQPIYHLFGQIIALNNRVVVNNELLLDEGHYAIDFIDLEQKLAIGAKILVFSSPHSPVGRVWNKKELERVGELCLKYNTLLVSDEVYADLVYPGYSHTPLAALSDAVSNNTITCMSPSKTFNLAGLQTAYLIISNPQHRECYAKEQQRLDLTTPNYFGIIALEAAYTKSKEWLEDLLIYLEKNINYVTEFLQQHFPEIKVIRPEATYVMWLDCRELGMDSSELINFFYQKAKLGVGHGYKFGLGGEGFVRLNIGCPQEILRTALDRLIRARKLL